MRARSLDHQFSSDDAQGRLPAKKPRQHRWVATAMFTTTEDALLTEGSVLDQENLVTLEAGCVDCEQGYGSHQRYCPAPAYTGFD